MKMMIKNVIKKGVVFYHQVFTTQASLTKEKHFFFSHIPKTAGTSFRAAFELTAVTYKDYKNNTKVLSKAINQLIYKNQDFYAFKQCFTKNEIAWITGHVMLDKYIDLVQVTHSITFMRNPVERVISQYQHHVKYHGFTRDLSTFLSLPVSKNIQAKYLGYLPLSLIGHVGITEQYNDSLFLINQQYGFDFSFKNKNINTQSKTSFDALDESLKLAITKQNSRDIKLYHEALFLHESRMSFIKQSIPWTYGYAMVNRRGVLQGCAYQYNNDVVINLSIKINDKVVKVVAAKGFYSLHPKANFPRKRYIGFNFKLPESIDENDKIDVYVQGTEQKLNFKPLTVKK